MRPMDQLGNVLSKGDMVVLVSDKGTPVIGFIEEINEGSIITPSAVTGGKIQGQQMPGVISISLMQTQILFDPTQPSRCRSLFKVTRPPELDTHKA